MNENEMMVDVEINEEEMTEESGSTSLPKGAVAGIIGLVGAGVAGAAIAIKKSGGVKGIKSKVAEKNVARLEKKLEKAYTKIKTDEKEVVKVEAEVIEE